MARFDDEYRKDEYNSSLFDEDEISAKLTYCEKCGGQYIEDYTSCNCIKKKVELIDGIKPIDWALKRLEEK